MQVTIDAVGAQGDGQAQLNGETIYVPYTLPGDVVELATGPDGKGYRAGEIVTPSVHRADPVCEHFGRCGGCALQHAAPDWYANWTQEQVKVALSHRGIEDVQFAPISLSPLGARRRVKVTALARRKGDVVLGFQARGSHHIVDVKHCPVLHPDLEAILPQLKAFMAETLLPRDKAMSIQMTQTETGVDMLLEGRGELSLDQRMDLVDFAQQANVARIARLDISQKRPIPEMVAEPRQPMVTLGGVKVALPMGAFLQATAAGEAALVSAVKQGVGDAARVVDLFAGCGTFSLPLAATARVMAVEGDPEMTNALQRAVNGHKGLREVVTERRDLFRRPLIAQELAGFDAVVIDPPRAGAVDQIEQIAASKVNKVVMVSCNPATFARDTRTLLDSGFTLGTVQVVDQFVYSPHVEVVASLSR